METLFIRNLRPTMPITSSPIRRPTLPALPSTPPSQFNWPIPPSEFFLNLPHYLTVFGAACAAAVMWGQSYLHDNPAIVAAWPNLTQAGTVLGALASFSSFAAAFLTSLSNKSQMATVIAGKDSQIANADASLPVPPVGVDQIAFALKAAAVAALEQDRPEDSTAIQALLKQMTGGQV